MKQTLQRKLYLIALLSAASFFGSVKALYRIRSQSFDSANFWIGMTNFTNLYGAGRYGTGNIKYEFNKNFRGSDITNCLFGDALIDANGSNGNLINCNTGCSTRDCNRDGGQRLLIQGSGVANRNERALLADYFALPLDFQSEVTFCPSIKQHIFDFSFYMGFDELLCGSWFFVHAPIVHARWSLNAHERVINRGTQGLPFGYFGPPRERDTLLNNFSEYAAGVTPPACVGGALTGADACESLNAGRFEIATDGAGNCANCPSRSETKLSDIHFALGWNFWQEEDYHVGLGILFVAPTGTRIRSDYLFLPQIGNGRHFELGAVFTSHYTFWRSCDYSQSWTFLLYGQVAHMFKTCQQRVFDLCNSNCNTNSMSKYMLASRFVPTSNGLLGNPNSIDENGDVPANGYTQVTHDFDSFVLPVANLTNTNVNVSVPIQGDVAAMFNYTSCNFSWDIGYKFYGRSCEKFECIPNLFDGTTRYGLKGDSYVAGTAVTTVNGILAPTPPGIESVTALPVTQHDACITSGRNFAGVNPNDATAVFNASRNPNVDNAQFAYTANQDAIMQQAPTDPAFPLPVADGPSSQTRLSVQPIFLTNDDVDFAGNRTSDRTHTIFTHFNYEWADDYACWIPYVGVGAKAEIASRDCKAKACGPIASGNRCGDLRDCGDRGDCKRCGLTQWGVWIKGGVAFN